MVLGTVVEEKVGRQHYCLYKKEDKRFIDNYSLQVKQRNVCRNMLDNNVDFIIREQRSITTTSMDVVERAESCWVKNCSWKQQHGGGRVSTHTGGSLPVCTHGDSSTTGRQWRWCRSCTKQQHFSDTPRSPVCEQGT